MLLPLTLSPVLARPPHPCSIIHVSIVLSPLSLLSNLCIIFIQSFVRFSTTNLLCPKVACFSSLSGRLSQDAFLIVLGCCCCCYCYCYCYCYCSYYCYSYCYCNFCCHCYCCCFCLLVFVKQILCRF